MYDLRLTRPNKKKKGARKRRDSEQVRITETSLKDWLRASRGLQGSRLLWHRQRSRASQELHIPGIYRM